MANFLQIEKYLKEKKISYKLISLRSSPAKRDAGLKVIDLGGEVFTVDQVKKSGVEEDEIVKTLVIRIGRSQGFNQQNVERSSIKMQFMALAIRRKDRVDFKKVRRLFGSKSGLARPEEVLMVCHVPVGAVCPILIEAPLYFDQKVMSLKHVNMGSGDLKKGLEMKLSDLLLAVGDYKLADMVIDDP